MPWSAPILNVIKLFKKKTPTILQSPVPSSGAGSGADENLNQQS